MRKQIVLAAGVGSRSGDTHRLFGGLRAFLIDEGGFAPSDFHEATYAGEYRDGRWVGPAPYDIAAFDHPLTTMVAHCAQALLYWARRLSGGPTPDGGSAGEGPVEWHLVGYSLGGLVLLEAAALLHRRASDSWGRYLRSVTTLSAPLNGCNLGELRWLADLFGPGAVSRELCSLAEDPRHRRRLETDVAGLRAGGVTVTTLVDADDAVIQPEDGIVGPLDPTLIVASRGGPSDAVFARHLGHGRILNEPQVWRRLLAIIGPQGTPSAPAPERGRVLITPPPRDAAGGEADAVRSQAPSADDGSRARRRDALLEQQLQELKERLRAEGRLPPGDES